MKLGAFDFLEKPVDRDRLLTVVWKAARAQRVSSRTERLEAVVTRDSGGVRIVTSDQRVTDLLQLLARIAPSDVSVLVVGESGTGKELIARELHRLSGRHAEPLVALNCAAVAESLAESELFGHEKGAFTGAASRKMGLIELSHGGTLFLDEVGDLTLSLQAKLLRALESKMFRRVGGVKELPTNFRLVSATNRPLQKLVDEGAFRGDLFYRSTRSCSSCLRSESAPATSRYLRATSWTSSDRAMPRTGLSPLTRWPSSRTIGGPATLESSATSLSVPRYCATARRFGSLIWARLSRTPTLVRARRLQRLCRCRR